MVVNQMKRKDIHTLRDEVRYLNELCEKDKKKKKKKKKKYSFLIGEDCVWDCYSPNIQPGNQKKMNFFHPFLLNSECESGFFFGLPDTETPHMYIGMRQGTEGHIAIIGSTGSGKSSGIVKPTLKTWDGALCVTDIKGELSHFYAQLYEQKLVTRPYIIFDPFNPDSVGYDPFSWLIKDDESNIVRNIWEIALAIIPVLPDDKQPFWADSERSAFAAALLYFFQRGYSFSESIMKIMSSTISEVCMEIIEDKNLIAKMFLGEISSMKPDIMAAIDRGIRNKLMLFSTDPHLSNAFRGARENASHFTWDDLEKYNIFLRIPETCLEQWSGAINLMYTQLIRHLERRPDMHSAAGTKNIPTLLLLDEFARFGKLEMITNALATLRSKNVNICLILQSVAQLDRIYGVNERRILFDNCQFKAILQVNDPETQRMICDLIGTQTTFQRSFTKNFDILYYPTSYSQGFHEIREPFVYPHELSSLNDTLLLTPQGFFRINKGSCMMKLSFS